jgi:hypothetical protein
MALQAFTASKSVQSCTKSSTLMELRRSKGTDWALTSAILLRTCPIAVKQALQTMRHNPLSCLSGSQETYTEIPEPHSPHLTQRLRNFQDCQGVDELPVHEGRARPVTRKADAPGGEAITVDHVLCRGAARGNRPCPGSQRKGSLSGLHLGLCCRAALQLPASPQVVVTRLPLIASSISRVLFDR